MHSNQYQQQKQLQPVDDFDFTRAQNTQQALALQTKPLTLQTKRVPPSQTEKGA